MNRETLLSVTALTAALTLSTGASAQVGGTLPVGDIALPTIPATDGEGKQPRTVPKIDDIAPTPIPAPVPGPDGFCKADTNRNKVVNYEDLFAYLAMYFAGEKGADMNGDAALGSSDLFEYLAHFVGGC
ncbi:MAG: GC-type dockerin domain-anchored protein [Phycisphaerales bacterium]